MSTSHVAGSPVVLVLIVAGGRKDGGAAADATWRSACAGGAPTPHTSPTLPSPFYLDPWANNFCSNGVSLPSAFANVF